MGSFSGPRNVTDSDYNYHVCTTSGTFTPFFSGNIEVLVVAGGGGGGMDMGGGGGGGGVVHHTSYAVTSGTGYTVTVGAGGVGAPEPNPPTGHQFTVSATQGGNSVFGAITAVGGGYGGSSYFGYTPNNGYGGAGGSGGGASAYSDGSTGRGGGTTANTAAGGTSYGNLGGGSTGQYYAGGGGGAGGAGQSGSNADGGNGVSISILGYPVRFGGGGGGSSYSLGAGGIGGLGGGGGGAGGTRGMGGTGGLEPGEPGGPCYSGNWGNSPGGAGGANTGGGGGGGFHYMKGNRGGNGGSGIVIIRYLKSMGSSTFNGQLASPLSSLLLSLDAAENSCVEVLVVAGGGGSGMDMGGGGGGGGVVYRKGFPISINTAYSVVVGGGGAGSPGTYGADPAPGSNGADSSFGGLTAIGGGGGGSGHWYLSTYPGTRQGQAGGCGGGDSPLYGFNRLVGGGGGIKGQGFGGGGGPWYGQYNAGGGGGAGQPGSSGSDIYGGHGGLGFYSDITGTGLYWGGGGGGNSHSHTGGIGGPGGGGGGASYYSGAGAGGAGYNNGGTGGTGANSTGGAGGANTGGGGGGSSHYSSVGANGGSGIVVVRYSGSQKATGGSISTANGYTTHIFTSSGTFTPTSYLDLKDYSERDNKIKIIDALYSSENNGVFNFDNDIIDTTFPASTIANSTLEAMIYPTVNGRYVAIIQINSNTDDALYVYPTNVLGFWPHGPSSLPVAINQWSYVAASYDGSGVRYCVNGNFQYNSGASSDFTDYQYIRVGGISTTDGERFIGKIALAKVYNRALSQQEMLRNFQALRGRFGI